MENITLISDLIIQLQNEMKRIYSEIETRKLSKKEQDRINLRAKAMFDIIFKELIKLKSIKEKQKELSHLKNRSNFLTDKLIKLNEIMINSINKLKVGHNLLKLSSRTQLNQSSLLPRELINFTIRVNSNSYYPLEYKDTEFIPRAFSNPYPLEEKEIKLSFLKFDLDEKKRLKLPVIKPLEDAVKKGTPLQLSYPDKEMQGVFFEYTLSTDLIPSFFSGILVIIIFINIF
jgi:hypothetical protein